jgi:hypothetical protein
VTGAYEGGSNLIKADFQDAKKLDPQLESSSASHPQGITIQGRLIVSWCAMKRAKSNHLAIA